MAGRRGVQGLEGVAEGDLKGIRCSGSQLLAVCMQRGGEWDAGVGEARVMV